MNATKRKAAGIHLQQSVTLESEMLFQLRAVGIEPLTQYKFHPTRKFKADFAILEKKLIAEVNGGTWMVKSGHNTGQGISRDYEKANQIGRASCRERV